MSSPETFCNSTNMKSKLPLNTSLSFLSSSSVLFSLYLSKNNSIHPKIRFYKFYDNFILIYKSNQSVNPQIIIHIDSQIKIESINEHDIPQNCPCYSFKIIKNNDSLNLMTFNIHDYNLIIDYFNKRCFFINFHHDYRPIKKIGKGTFAKIYLVENIVSHTQYAVKSFSKFKCKLHKNGEKIIMNEIKILRSMSSSHIVKLHQVYETEHSYYLIMEYLQGGTLNEHLNSNYSARSILKEITKALIYLNSMGIIHRDLKPENILFRESNPNNIQSGSNFICLIDFGLSTFLGCQNELFGQCGTPGYISPEISQKIEGEKYNCISDIYSLGVIFHLMLLDFHPFKGKNIEETMKNNNRGVIEFDSIAYETLNYYELDLLKKMLEKDPKKRISPSDILIHPYFKENIFLPKIDLNSDSFENSNVIQTTDSVSTNSIESKPDQKETENTIQLIKNDHHCHSPCVDTEIKNTKLNGKMKIKVYRFQACDFTIPINHQN